MKSLSKVILSSAVFAPSKMFACAACYANGATINDPMTHGVNWAIFTLGAVVGTVVVTFVTYFIYIVRKGEAIEAARAQASAARPAVKLEPLPADSNPKIKTENPQFA